MNRRSFLAGIFAAACAPAIVRADSLMRIVPRETVLLGTQGVGTVRLFRGELGRYNDVRFVGGLNDPLAVKRWAEMMYRDTMRKSYFTTTFAPQIRQLEMFQTPVDGGTRIEVVTSYQ